MRVEPTELDEVISVTSAIWPRWRSSGVATLVAMASGLAPGMVARTEMVGKSTCGNGETGSRKNASAAGQRDAEGQQRGGDGPADEGRGEVHGAGPPLRSTR